MMNPGILGIRVDNIRKPDVHRLILEAVKLKEKIIIGHANVFGANLAYSDSEFRKILNTFDKVFCDGFGIMLGAKILGYTIIERITYAEWAWDLAGLCMDNNLSLYLLGAKPSIAVKATKKIKERFDDIRIVGVHHGYFDKTLMSTENQLVINEINSCKPNVLIVGMGMPIQEYWLQENIDSLDINVALTGGAVFDYLSGELKRAPKWMTDNGLEWLGRLIIEPRRLWGRYIFGNPIFLWRVLLQRLGLLRFPT